MFKQSLLATLELAKLASVSTPSPTPSSMPISHILHYHPGNVTRFLDLSQSEVIFDLTAALAATAYHGISSYRYVLIIGSNATSSATVEAYTGPSESSVASAITATLHVPPTPYWLTVDNDRNRFPMRHTYLDLGSQRTEPYLRLVISNPTNPAGYLDVGVMFPHPGYVPALAIETAPSMSLVEDQSAVITAGRTKHTRPMPIFRTRSFALLATGPTAKAEVEQQWLGLEETIGLHDPFLFISDLSPSSSYMNHFMYGHLTGFEPILLPESYQMAKLIVNYEELK